jgi:hypothetical protein
MSNSKLSTLYKILFLNNQTRKVELLEREEREKREKSWGSRK